MSSIKKLFDSTDKNLNYEDYQTEKEAFESVESMRNAQALQTEQQTFVPQIDYTDPKNFAFFGSAELYYSGSFEKISGYYPYDGSDAEQNEFYNSLLEVDKYIFNNVYPRSNGFVTISNSGWGSRVGSQLDGYGMPNTLEYITFKGGPNTGSAGSTLVQQSPNPYSSLFNYGNIYADSGSMYNLEGLPSDYGKGTRLSNMRANFDDGVTVEFWMKTGSFASTLTERQVLVDMWNNAASSSADYGRITIFLDANPSTSGQPFTFVVESGSTKKTSRIGPTIANNDFTAWKHYALSLYNTGSTFNAKLYINGALNDTYTVDGIVSELNSKNMMGRLGALLTASSGLTNPVSLTGAGKLSGSIDEFRYWKSMRSSKQIGQNWFDQVGGGVNTDISNTTLGVYYKFNEGVTGVTSTDSIVLDYAGRASNGVWTGYASGARSTNSAIVLAGAATNEHKDPIIRTNNPSYTSARSNLLSSGSYHDLNNNSQFVNYAPEWVISLHEDTENTNLKIISHVVGAYFDKLYLLASQMPSLRQLNYTSASAEPLPFAQHLPQSLGLYSPDIFIDADIMENLLNRDGDSFFEGNLKQTKDLIYQNLYNNLAHIFKAKGTEKAIRNVMRCFNLDDSLVRFKTYAKNTTYEIKNNLKQIVLEDRYLNFNKSANISATVYQRVSSSNAESTGYITASRNASAGQERAYGFTAEADITFPRFYSIQDSITRTFTDVSLFGGVAVSVRATSSNGTDTTFLASDPVNFGVYAVRTEPESKNVQFKLSSSIIPIPFPVLTSSVFSNVYADSQWNLSVRVKPKNYPLSYIVTGSTSDTYDVIFRGVNSYLGVVQNSFEISSSITATSGSNFLVTPKRMYVGARRQNMTGAVLQYSDVQTSNLKVWTKYLDNQSLNHHIYDFDNSGISASYENISGLDNKNNYFDLLNRDTLALEWNFDSVTGSDSSGNFYVQDYSSGSAVNRDNFGWLGKITGYQHSGYGYGWPISSTDPVIDERINTYQILTPEEAVGSDMIQILSEDDTLYEIMETVPDYVFTLEKGLHQAISEEMMNFLAGVGDFNNLVGEPVNRYRGRYKNMEVLREAFFRRVQSVATVEKYLEYYKWFDAGLSQIVEQLLPLSADFVPELYNVVESHVLERPKYDSKFPTLEAKAEDPSGKVPGASEWSYPGSLGGSPLPFSPRKTTEHIAYWKKRAERTAVEITSGDATVDAQRETYRKVINSVPNLSSSATIISAGGSQYEYDKYQKASFGKQYLIETEAPHKTVIHGGVNFDPGKKIDFTYAALRPAGPANQTGGKFVPENVLLSFVSEFTKIPIDNDPPKVPSAKIKRNVRVQHGREFEQGIGYSNVKSSMAFPFNIISASVQGGYNAEASRKLSGNINIVNIHNDAYGPDMEIPMQGPFTNYAVGGHQSRHIALNSGPTLDNYLTRAEAWKILLGTCEVTSGAIGMVGPDYPYPEANAVGAVPYPMTGAQKAYLYRDFVAKRPVNIKNIRMRTGSTILGNYSQPYEVVMSVGAYSNPRHFVDNQPSLPSQVVQGPTTGATSVRTFLDLRRGTDSHFEFVSDYSIGYLTGTNNHSIIRGTFAAPGGMDTMTFGYQDLRAAEYSVYNSLNYRNLSIKGHSQPSNVSQSQVFGSKPAQTRVYDIHGKDYGLRPLLSRHAGKFFRDSLFQTNPGASYSQLPSFQKNHRNTLTRLKLNASEVAYSSSVYDNAFVVHQIPRSSKQYAWISGNVIDDNNVYGFTPTDFYLSDSLGIREAYNMISSSDFGSLVNNSGNRVYGVTEVQGTTLLKKQFYPNVLSRLNTNLLSHLTKSSNTVGLETNANVRFYVNTDFAALPTTVYYENLATASMLNSVLLSRGGAYGHPSWQQIRNADNPILVAERADNMLSLRNTDGETITRYDMPPVTMRGRPIMINFDSTSPDGRVQNITLRTSFNNARLYFNTNELNDRFTISLDSFTTPFQQLTRLTRRPGFKANWVIYSENLFPSQRNEFLTRTRERIGYSNDFWRANREDRNITGSNSWGQTSNVFKISSSMFALDAPYDFLTRTGPPLISNTSSNLTIRRSYFVSGNAGELQNTYTTYWTSSYGFWKGNYHGGSQFMPTAGRNGIGALYARKHMIGSPRSVINPSAFDIPETGSQVTWDNFLSSVNQTQVEICSGEAYWDAPTQAGIIEVQDGTSSFVSYPSEPWFDEYGDFKEQLQLAARDYSIVPEFRISENIKDYMKGGIGNPGKTNDFEIVGTGIRSNSSSFYRDYSNSEFLQNFKTIKSDTQLDASEIRLVCSAAIRFNPYKGFYPAQRSLQVVEQFVDSYAENINVSLNAVAPKGQPGKSSPLYGTNRAIAAAISSPGILYNTIKSGLAVDYPVVSHGNSMRPCILATGSNSRRKNNNVTMATGRIQSAGAASLQSAPLTGSFFSNRLPFETIINPDKYLVGQDIMDMESHPSAGYYPSEFSGHAGASKGRGSFTNTLQAAATNDLYTRISRNFFGAIPDFFLKDSQFTRLESDVVTDDLQFGDNETYMARIKLFRSTTGSRNYLQEKPCQYSQWYDNGPFAMGGAKPYFGDNPAMEARFSWGTGSQYYPLPQDPVRQQGDTTSDIPAFRETFTMYSRPSAFGPPYGGLIGGPPGKSVSLASPENIAFKYGVYTGSTVYDSITGHNPAFTPPYYDGEGWVDLIFRPTASVSYDLDRILAETIAIYRRFDPGIALTSSHQMFLGQPAGTEERYKRTMLIHDQQVDGGLTPPLGGGSTPSSSAGPYSGRCINANSMQVSASIDLFGIERVQFVEKDKFGNELSDRNTTIGKKWVIQPKCETPMMNFNPYGTRQLTSSEISMPIYGSASVSRGMWHQFGVIPDDPNTGIFLQIEDMNRNWLQYHPDVINTSSIYNNYENVLERRYLYWNTVKSLTSLVGFDKKTPKKRLGELKESLTVKEAIVAVPYIITEGARTSTQDTKSVSGKKFISIPRNRFDASLSDVVDTEQGNSLDLAGKSIREQIQKMQNYVLPPQFNFIDNRSIDPVVMYIFEFSYTFDKDDLSYIWQNLAPRDYKKISFQSDSVNHMLANNELMSADNLNHENLRWMVFKVKQKSQANYYDYILGQAGQASNDAFLRTPSTPEDLYLQYNWPYDYLSFVELIKMDGEILFKPKDHNQQNKDNVPGQTTGLQADAVAANRPSGQQAAATGGTPPPAPAPGGRRPSRRPTRRNTGTTNGSPPTRGRNRRYTRNDE